MGICVSNSNHDIDFRTTKTSGYNISLRTCTNDSNIVQIPCYKFEDNEPNIYTISLDKLINLIFRMSEYCTTNTQYTMFYNIIHYHPFSSNFYISGLKIGEPIAYTSTNGWGQYCKTDCIFEHQNHTIKDYIKWGLTNTQYPIQLYKIKLSKSILHEIIDMLPCNQLIFNDFSKQLQYHLNIQHTSLFPNSLLSNILLDSVNTHPNIILNSN